MSKHAAARFLAQKAKQSEQRRREAQARKLAPGCHPALALEILKAQERAEQRSKIRAENLAKVRGTK